MKNLKNLAELTSAARNRREVLRLPLDIIISKPQVRVQFTHLDELAQSLKEEGQQSPIIVSPPNSSGQYVIQKGERRWRAAQLAGLATVDAIINNKEQQEADLLAGQLIENIQREDLLPLEIGMAVGQLIKAGWKQREIAQRLGKSESYVSLYANLSDVNDSIKQVHDQGLVTDSSSLFSLKKMFELNESYAHDFLKDIQEKGSVSRNEVRQRMAQLQSPQRTEEVVDKDIIPATTTPSVKKNIESVLAQPVIAQEKSVEIQDNNAYKIIAPQDFLVEVLVTMENGEDQIGKLLIGHLSDNANKAWVLIDKVPVEADITAIQLLEIRERNG